MGERIRLIRLEPWKGRKRRIISIKLPYCWKACCHWMDLSIGKRFRNIFEPSSGGIGRRLNMAREMLVAIKI